jgi:hypothetical protein
METQHHDGGPAFPAPAGVSHITLQGMTLRDWFAGQALSGIRELQGNYVSDSDQERRTAERRAVWAAEAAYRYADAMLGQRMLVPHE